MKIISSIAEDVWHELPGSSYEWWYFDAISADGYALVITFFYGLPFSPYYNRKIVAAANGKAAADPGDHSAFYLCLYDRRGTLCYALNEHARRDFAADKRTPAVRIGKCTLNFDEQRGFVIDIDAPARFRRHVNGEIIFKPEHRELNIDSGSDDGHIWNCVAPRCAVNGQLKIRGLFGARAIEFRGQGYHDHNHGLRPMHHDMARWHWGRLHTAQQTSIYYIVEKADGAREGMLAAFSDRGEEIYCGPAAWQAQEKRHLMGLRYYPEIEVTGGPLRLNICNRRAVDEGPFYLRFLAEQQLHSNSNGNGSLAAAGFAEAFEPEKLFIKAYWPFIKMRIRKFS